MMHGSHCYTTTSEWSMLYFKGRDIFRIILITVTDGSAITGQNNMNVPNHSYDGTNNHQLDGNICTNLAARKQYAYHTAPV